MSGGRGSSQGSGTGKGHKTKNVGDSRTEHRVWGRAEGTGGNSGKGRPFLKSFENRLKEHEHVGEQGPSPVSAPLVRTPCCIYHVEPGKQFEGK